MRTCLTVDTTIMSMLKTSYHAQFNFRDAIVDAKGLPKPTEVDPLSLWVEQLDKLDGYFPETVDENMYFVPRLLTISTKTVNAEIQALKTQGKPFLPSSFQSS